MFRGSNFPRRVSQRTVPDRNALRGFLTRVFSPSKTHSREEQRYQENRGNTPGACPRTDASQGESYYRDTLARKLNGKTEVSIPVGRIDILTDTEIIEVKAAKQWKAALGQIIVYGKFYPRHQKRIHLFGDKLSCDSSLIERTCLENAIAVSWEDDEL